jgi:hypothetical protein
MTTDRMPNGDTTTLTTLLSIAPDLVERDRIRRQALRVGAVRHDGLAVLREAAFAGEGLALTWEIPLDGESLCVGEGVLAALAPVAAGLALLHDAGLAHGGVTADSVHVHLGHGILSGWRPGGTPEGDVADLVTLIDAYLPSASVGADVAQVLIAGSDPDPAARPSMARLAAVLARAADERVPHISPPAHRRARLGEAPPPRPAEVGAQHAAARPPMPGQGRGRHAARRAPAGTRSASLSTMRVPWRWGLAAAGAMAAAFLGFSALGSAGSAQEICPAVPATSAWSSLVQQAIGG